MSSQKYVCIHGHFYQPARENPWTGKLDLAADAYPYHDWNERITAQCYGANAWSQIRNAADEVSEVVNNYAHISFNFGPTLLLWLSVHAPFVYEQILAADKASAVRFSGHGSALAQCYNHLIMPLANRRDRVTQVLWGIDDFRYRFGRRPEGMWLPETAVDLETLEALVDSDIRFTILSPRQIAATRGLGEAEWRTSTEDTLDTRHPYLVRLPSARSIVVFVYHGATARAVAFERLLESGDQFAARLLSVFSSEPSDGPQLAHIATDGESYGHHHSFGDMALAYALRLLERKSGIHLTNYGEYLARHKPRHEACIVENTSWSCLHGVGRWQSDCGCRSGQHPTWNQKWRAPLREAFDWLRDEIAPRYEQAMSRLVRDPWAVRDGYITLILDHTEETERAFLATYSAKRLGPAQRRRLLGLLEMQRHLMLMYSSCGWFFDDVAGTEASLVMAQAARAIDYARSELNFDPEPGLLDILQRAVSNRLEAGTAADVYRRMVAKHRPASGN